MPISKDIKELQARAEKYGFRVVRTRTGHFTYYDPDGNWVSGGSNTASDHRAVKNLRAALRRAGLPREA